MNYRTKLHEMLERSEKCDAPITDFEALKDCLWHLQSDRDKILQSIFKPFTIVCENGKRFENFSSAYSRLANEFGIFYAHARFGTEEYYNENISSAEINRSIYSFTSFGETLVQGYRNLTKCLPDSKDALQQLREIAFQDQPHLPDVIKKIRNAALHSDLMDFYPTLSRNFETDKHIQIEIKITDAQKNDDRVFNNADSKLFFEQNPEISWDRLFNLYFERMQYFFRRYISYSKLRDDTRFQNAEIVEQVFDFLKIQNTLNLISQNLEKRNATAIDFLDVFFNTEEVARIESLNFDHDKQIQFAIRLRDPLGIGGEELEKKIRELFQYQ